VSIGVALLQGALGGIFLIIVLIILIAAVVVAGAIFGGALSGGGSEQEAAPIIPPGTILAASGLALAVLGAFYASSGFNFLGIMLGALAYYRGARVLGGVVCAVSFITIFIGYTLSSGAYQFSF
jgi:hypothetical protein